MARKRGKKPKRRAAQRLVRKDGGPNATPDTPPDELISERASASVLTPANDTSATPSPHVAGVSGPFHTLLDWFSRVATHPRSAADGIEQAAAVQAELGADSVEAIVRPTDRMTAIDRMQIYQYAYHARLVGCLEDDYPTVAHALGAARFELLARKYIEAHPSDRANLNGFGRHFSAFCGEQAGWLEHNNFYRDLAKLEWAMVEVIHAEATEPASMEELSTAPQEKWPDVRLPAAPTLRFLEFEYPVNAFLQATREGRSPPLPAAAWSAVAVYRQDYRIWRMGFTKPMAKVLETLLAGRTLGEALGRLEEPGVADQIGESDVMVWFKEWMTGGFFERVVI